MKKDFKQEIKKLNIIFLLLILCFIIATGVVLILKVKFEFPDFIEAGNLSLYFSPLLMMIAIIVSYYFYNRIKEKAKAIDNIDEKFALYKKAQLSKYLFLTFAGLIAAFTLLGQYLQQNVFIPGIILLFFFLNVPTKNKFEVDFLNKRVEEFKLRKEELEREEELKIENEEKLKIENEEKLKIENEEKLKIENEDDDKIKK